MACARVLNLLNLSMAQLSTTPPTQAQFHLAVLFAHFRRFSLCTFYNLDDQLLVFASEDDGIRTTMAYEAMDGLDQWLHDMQRYDHVTVEVLHRFAAMVRDLASRYENPFF